MSISEHGPLAAEMDTPWPAEALRIHNYLAPLFGNVVRSCIEELCEPAESGAPTVEIGAGLGILGVIIPDKLRKQYIQTEAGADNCVIAQATNIDTPTLAARAQELPFRSESVGNIIARNLFDMVDTPAVVQELGRVLEPGGKVVHLHDHRPSLIWLHQNFSVGNSKRLIPYFTDRPGTSMQQFQIVKWSALRKALPNSNAEQLKILCNPHYQEFLSGDDQYGLDVGNLRLLAKHAESVKERITPTFIEIMNTKLRGWFAKTGFTSSFQRYEGSVDVPLHTAQQLGVAQYGANKLTYDCDGSYGLSRQDDVPAGQYRVAYSTNVAVAIKQRQALEKISVIG